MKYLKLYEEKSSISPDVKKISEIILSKISPENTEFIN